jgi:hypothetical protein
MIGQPPRSKGKGFDQHEQEVWFDQIYRYLKELSVEQNTPVSAGMVSAGTNEPVSVVMTAAKLTENNSKRYLRWLGI